MDSRFWTEVTVKETPEELPHLDSDLIRRYLRERGGWRGSLTGVRREIPRQTHVQSRGSEVLSIGNSLFSHRNTRRGGVFRSVNKLITIH